MLAMVLGKPSGKMAGCGQHPAKSLQRFFIGPASSPQRRICALLGFCGIDLEDPVPGRGSMTHSFKELRDYDCRAGTSTLRQSIHYTRRFAQGTPSFSDTLPPGAMQPTVASPDSMGAEVHAAVCDRRP